MRFLGRVFEFGLGDSAVCVDGKLVLFDEFPRFREIRGHLRLIEHADEAGTLLRNFSCHNLELSAELFKTGKFQRVC